MKNDCKLDSFEPSGVPAHDIVLIVSFRDKDKIESSQTMHMTWDNISKLKQYHNVNAIDEVYGMMFVQHKAVKTGIMPDGMLFDMTLYRCIPHNIELQLNPMGPKEQLIISKLNWESIKTMLSIDKNANIIGELYQMALNNYNMKNLKKTKSKKLSNRI